MERFGRISEIDPGAERTWQDRVFLTLDIDWAHDEVLAACIDLVEQAGVAATWFITHDTPLLQRLVANPRFELGIHPNFNPLLAGETAMKPEAVLERLLGLVPQARSVRSHSLVQSTGLHQLFAARGLTHDCNHYVPHQSGIALRPWPLWTGLVKVPHFWEDDLACAYGVGLPEGPATAGLQVYDFHPIHVFLNTETLERYERTRPLHRSPRELLAHRHAGAGTRTWLLQLLERAA
ncbi:MAG TPA: hypothetical protein VHL79_07000 [Ramlibacter sp.]|nr:hypothetical protein [Ramlibacter sp.]